ncbi:hypothetical protein [Acidihalobacter prosperus]|uniref:Uncharacterized protein n=1 Tax=Acidihalobacter prosperus TaxID=160660 RepID=A0A1A6C2T2_9GAMM|nr:hypothetical protein [Acidihalobacter prosperus]OBS08855.1 hypothetical protein Thpro_023105 [Acidihalobacter prosperus]
MTAAPNHGQTEHPTASRQVRGAGNTQVFVILVAVIAAIGYLTNVIDMPVARHLGELRGIGSAMPLLGAILGYV